MPKLRLDLTEIPYVWSSLTKDEQQDLLVSYPIVGALTSSLTWMHEWTKTQDEHDSTRQYKALPKFRCFDALHDLFLNEDKLFLKKSRTVMATWWGAGECLHYIMTHQPASCIFWCPDQDRAEVCIRYCKILYAQQDPELKKLYPLPRKKKTPEDQAVYKFELAGGGWLEALPGKNPDKIRSQHPTIVFMDEAAFNPEGGEAYDNAVSTQPHKLVGVSSVKQGWFTDLLAPAVEVDSPSNGKGFSVSRILRANRVPESLWRGCTTRRFLQ